MQKKRRNSKKVLPSLLMLLGLLCLFGPGCMKASAGGEGNSTYNLWIDGRQVDDGNCSDVWNDSVFFFEPESSTLYIYGDHTATTINPVIRSDLPSLTVIACADSLLKTENDRKLIQTSGDIQIKGDGYHKLNLSKKAGYQTCIEILNGKQLTIQDVDMTITNMAGFPAVIGDSSKSSLKFQNCNVTIGGTVSGFSGGILFEQSYLTDKAFYYTYDGGIYSNNDWETHLGADDLSSDVEIKAESSELDDAMNIEGGGLHFISTGDYAWRAEGSEGDRCGISSNQGKPNSTSTVTTRVTVDYRAVISFCYKAWGESVNYDHGYFMIDGEIYGKWGGVENEDWIETNYYLTQGMHTLEWGYVKDDSVNYVGDYFAVRDVKLLNEDPVPGQDLKVVLDPPTDGKYQASSTKVTPADSNIVSVDSVTWNAFGSEAPVSEIAPNGYHRLQIELSPQEGYFFDGQEAFTINGILPDSAEVLENQNLLVTVNYSFSKYKFTDVPVRPLQWAYEGINVANMYGIMTGDAMKEGETTTTFRPKDTVTRGEFTVILFRIFGDDNNYEATSEQIFKDVPYKNSKGKTPYYFAAVQWAAKNGIVTGYDDGTFRPGNPINRAQMALMLMRLLDYGGFDISKRADLSGMKDYSSIPAYGLDALSWAAAEGFITGRENGTVAAAKASTQRQECATVVKRVIYACYE